MKEVHATGAAEPAKVAKRAAEAAEAAEYAAASAKASACAEEAALGEDIALAARWIEEGRRAGAARVEVFLKSARSNGCRIGGSEPGPIEIRSERGLALRIWTPDGRAGFLHADAPESRSPAEMVRACISFASNERRGDLPRLPEENLLPEPRREAGAAGEVGGGADAASGEIAYGRGHVLDPDLAERLAHAAREIASAFASPGRRALTLLDGWIEAGTSRTVVINSVGGRAAFAEPIGSAGLWIMGGGAAHSAWGASSLWHTTAITDLASIVPHAVAEAAAWRTAASIGGGPLAAPLRCPVLLEPRSAAVWLRHLLPACVASGRANARERLREGSGARGYRDIPGPGVERHRGVQAAHDEGGRTRQSREPGAVGPSWLNFIDDPGLYTGQAIASDRARAARAARSGQGHGAPDARGSAAAPLSPAVPAPGAAHPVSAPQPIGIDGEGRAVGRRPLILNGTIQTSVFDSADPTAPETALGPMRRDSYRDRPEPGPLHPHLVPGLRSRESMLEQLDRGLFVTSLVPRSAPGGGELVAEVRGVWIEKGRAVAPVAGMCLRFSPAGSISKIVEVGSDAETDHHGPPIRTPSLLFDDVELAPL